MFGVGLTELAVIAFVALLVIATQAAAFPTTLKRQTISVLSQSAIAAFKPYTHYASTGYCKPATTLAWNCGANCEANPTFEPVASGGDGDAVQFCEYLVHRRWAASLKM